MEEEQEYYFDIEFIRDGESVGKKEVWSTVNLQESTSVLIDNISYVREDLVVDMLFNK